MSVELLVTRAVLEDRFSPVLRKMAGEQDAYARRTSQLNAVGNGLVMAGAGMTALAAKSVQVAASYDQQRQAFISLIGDADRGKAMFDDLAKFTIKTPFQLADWTQSTRTLLGWGMAAKDVMPALEGLGNSEASMGRTGPDLQKAAYELGEMNAGFISMRQVRNLMMDGVPAATMLKKELHLTGEELANIGKKHIDGKIGVKAILKGIADPENHLSKGMETQMGTLPGSVTSLKDNWNLFLDKMGEPALRPVTNLVNKTSDLLSNLEKMSDGTQKFVTVLAFASGPALIVAGSVFKAVAAYRAYKAILAVTKIAGDAERAGEKAKGPIADAEGAAVQGVTGKYEGLRGMLTKLGTAATAGTAAEGLFSSALVAGAVTVGAYAVALAGVLVVGYDLVSMWKDASDAVQSYEDVQSKVAQARAQGYDLAATAGQGTGMNGLPWYKQVASGFGHTWAGALINPALAAYGATLPDADETGYLATSDAASRALAKKHGMAPHGVRAQQIAAEKQAAAAAAAARQQAAADARQAAGNTANKYELDPAMAFKLAQDERRVALLKEMGGHEKELKAARAGEISDLKQAADLLDRQAAIATDLKAKYRLMDEAAEDRQKAALLGLEKTDKRDKLDKAVAQVLGGAGLSEDEILKRAGIGRAFFAGMGKGRPAQNPLAAALTQAAKRPLIVQVKIGDRTWLELKKEIVDDALLRQAQLARSSGRNTLFGSTN